MRALAAVLLALLPACAAADSDTPAQADPAPAPYAACGTDPDPERCAARVEAGLLEASGGRAARAGDTLVIHGTGGARLALDDVVDADRTLRFRYAGHLPELGQHLVRLSRFEGGGFVLVSAETTDQTQVLGPPLVAPGGTRFASLSLDVVAGHDPNGVQIWRVEPHGPVLEWELRGGSSWGPDEAAWQSDSVLDLTLVRPTGNPERPRRRRMRLDLGGGGLSLAPLASGAPR